MTAKKLAAIRWGSFFVSDIIVLLGCVNCVVLDAIDIFDVAFQMHAIEFRLQ